ncbi:OsmC family protein [Ornithinibacillus halotolerans]|uniref:Osmotically inducible protein C n=1 Tax=Ornithinibacillus halotolerans TaxID=1274357 RepID=A0A916W734_9BACI|nr:OsmC family protein [Ornithinibacillus halotolerans]GGA71989.1 osmotically inducible protein C [Ornithinibacillus halotolerans]
MKFQVGESGVIQGEFEYGELIISSNSEIGFRPVQLLVSSLAGCSGGVLKKVLEKKRIKFDSIDIEVDIERNEAEANRVTKLSLHFIVNGNHLNITTVQKSLNIAVKNCAMVQSVKDAIEIVETIEIREK